MWCKTLIPNHDPAERSETKKSTLVPVLLLLGPATNQALEAA